MSLTLILMHWFICHRKPSRTFLWFCWPADSVEQQSPNSWIRSWEVRSVSLWYFKIYLTCRIQNYTWTEAWNFLTMAAANLHTLNTKPRYKRERPSHFRQHLISILSKSCCARGRSELFPNHNTKLSRCKAIRTLIYFKLDESLWHSSLKFLSELAMQLRRYIWISRVDETVPETHV